jgi:predicted transcriptional regulator
MPTRVLLSVKPQFAEAILAGRKTFEFRRALFRRPDIETVVLYASSPTCKVVGEFTIDEVLSLALDALWETTGKAGRSIATTSIDISKGGPRAMP